MAMLSWGKDRSKQPTVLKLHESTDLGIEMVVATGGAVSNDITPRYTHLATMRSPDEKEARRTSESKGGLGYCLLNFDVRLRSIVTFTTDDIFSIKLRILYR